MAEKTAQELAAENEALKAQLATTEKENTNLRVANSKGKAVGSAVKGSFVAKWKDPVSGDDVEQKVEFKNGHRFLYLGGARVLTDAIIQIANGKKLGEKVIASNPPLANFTQEKAAESLTHLAKIGYGGLKEAKK